MPGIRTLMAVLFAAISLALSASPGAAQAEKRIALVIGNAGYQVGGTLNTPANDAGLIAQTLQAAGFDVEGARDLDQDSLRHAFRDFVEKATSSGPDTVAFVYLGGYGLQLEGENYFVPIDAKIARDADIPAEALRISDYTRPLAASSSRPASSFSTLRARTHSRNPVNRWPAARWWTGPGAMIAFNAAPGTVARRQGPYGPYAQALAEMIPKAGCPTGVLTPRLRVNEIDAGAEVPWHASKVRLRCLFERRGSPPPPCRPRKRPPFAHARSRARRTGRLYGGAGGRSGYPISSRPPRDPMVPGASHRCRAAGHFGGARVIDAPPAYWTYLRRYPDGPHGWNAPGALLSRLHSAAAAVHRGSL